MTRTRSQIIVGLAALSGVAMIGGGTMKLIGEAHKVEQFAIWGRNRAQAVQLLGGN